MTRLRRACVNLLTRQSLRCQRMRSWYLLHCPVTTPAQMCRLTRVFAPGWIEQKSPSEAAHEILVQWRRADLGADLTSGRVDPLPSRHMDPRLGPHRQKKTNTQSYRFPNEYWYGPPGKSQSYPASIPALASHRHRSKVQNYDASCFILANDGLMLFCASRRLWRVYTFAQAYLSLRHCTKISCAASDGDFCSIHPGGGEDSGESAHLCRCSYWTMQ